MIPANFGNVYHTSYDDYKGSAACKLDFCSASPQIPVAEFIERHERSRKAFVVCSIRCLKKVQAIVHGSTGIFKNVGIYRATHKMPDTVSRRLLNEIKTRERDEGRRDWLNWLPRVGKEFDDIMDSDA